MKFHSNIQNLMARKGINDGFNGSASTITVYSGSQPTAAEIVANWANYKSTALEFLVHYPSAYWDLPDEGSTVILSVPPPVVTLHAGVAAWAIVWATNVNVSAMSAATAPALSFIVVPVTDTLGGGVIRYASTNLASGVSAPISSGSISVASF